MKWSPNTLSCPNCGNTIQREDAFCAHCGTKIDRQQADEEALRRSICRVCGFLICPDDAFCANCGAEIETAGPGAAIKEAVETDGPVETKKTMEPVISEVTPKKRRRKAAAVAAGLTAVVLLGTVGYAVFVRDAAFAPPETTSPVPEVADDGLEKTPTAGFSDSVKPGTEPGVEPSPKPSTEGSTKLTIDPESVPSAEPMPEPTSTPAPKPTPTSSPTPKPTPTPLPSPTPTFPVGTSVALKYSADYTRHNGEPSEGITFTGLSAIKSADGTVTFTIEFTAEQDFAIYAFNPPEGDQWSNEGTAVSGQASFSFAINEAMLSQLSFITVNFYNNSGRTTEPGTSNTNWLYIDRKVIDQICNR